MDYDKTLKDKTLADFDKLANDGEKCALLDRYIDQSKSWLESVGRRGENGRWIRNLKGTRPQHKALSAPSAIPVVRCFIAYANHKTMMPEVQKKWPIAQMIPDQGDDKGGSDLVQARYDNFIGKAQYEKTAKKTVGRGMIMESAILELVPEMDENTGVISGKYRTNDIFSWFPSPGFTGSGMDLAAGETLFVAFRTAVNAEQLKAVAGVDVAIDPDAKQYSTQGMLGMWEKDFMGAAVFTRFFWLQTKVDPGTGQTVRYIRGVNYCKLKERVRDQYEAKILLDYEVDRDVVLDGELYPARLPIFRYVNDPDETVGFGTADPELVLNNQAEIERALSAGFTVLKRNALPIIFTSEDWHNKSTRSVVDDIMAGVPIVRNSPQDVQIDQPPTLNAGTMPLVELVTQYTDNSSGVYKSMAGDVKFSGMPMGAILALREAALERVGGKLDNEISDFVMDNGRVVYKLLKTKDGMIKNAMKLPVKGGGAVKYGAEVMQQAGRFDITVVVGGGLPKGRYATEARAQELLKSGMFTPLRAIDDLAETDTETIKQEYLQWNDLQKHIQMMSAESDAEKEFQAIVMKMMVILDQRQYAETRLDMADPNKPAMKKAEQYLGAADLARYKMELNDAWELLDQFPSLIKQDEFTLLPGPVQEDLLMKFYMPPPLPIAQPQIAEQSGAQPQVQGVVA